MLVRKEIIRPGTYTYLGKDGTPSRLTVDRERVKHLHDQGNAMLAAKLSVPVPIEHQPDAKPQSEADRAANLLRNNAGFVTKYEIGEVEEKGKKIENVLFGVLDIADADIAKKLPNTIRFSSPWINSFVDGTGKTWNGVISHLALTSRPRITEQQPFQPIEGMAAALSIVGKLKDSWPDEVGLSRAGLMIKEGKKLRPQFPMAFSLLTGVKLSEKEVEEIEEEEDEEADERPDNEGKERSPIAALDEPLEDTKKDVGIHEVIGHLLRALEMNPPDGMDETTFERDIYETLMARLIQLKAEEKAKEEEEEEEAEDDEEGPLDKQPIVQESPSMYASLEEVNAIQDPEKRKLAGMLFSLNKSNQAVKSRILQEATANRDQRLEKVLKHMPATRRDSIINRFKADGAKLSLDDNTGAIVDPMRETLEDLEWTVKEVFKDSAKFSEQPHPTDGQITRERAAAVTDEVLANTGGDPSKQREQRK